MAAIKKIKNIMIISTRRDAGYTVISRFEETFRDFLVKEISNITEDFYELIPTGIVAKATERNSSSFWEDNFSFMEDIDFPDLKEICLYKNNYKSIIKNSLDKKHFIKYFDELYLLRCKIAHVKGFFTSIDLDKLIELTSFFKDLFGDTEFTSLLNKIFTSPEKVIIKIPTDFIEDYVKDSGIINNLPTPDYEYEGGFVGRDDDRKKLIKLLKSEKFSVITITGAGGVGKTSLALKIIQDITQRKDNKFFESIVWLSAKENKLTPFGIEDIEPTLKSYEELLDIIIDLFEFNDYLKETTFEAKEELVEEIISLNNKMLIVIDNLETIK
ncbi:MAG: NB-ARC domain-containing protein, partial [Saprospiraceae bacterium]